ncbi:hypothetical protein [Pseudonocardia sp. N23]|uniref:hypothetical protein n=1 Tax=Pseudonocardia sp. N23 TaxID=1987376 RepID=UPI000C032408|nr:hypothetical protein [Pseudonocardia sp. N23]GAY13085.1 hypothetical protein TOK_2004 [Pseudonocardia sp. N23]
MFSNTFAEIAPTSVLGFVVAQLDGALVGAGLVAALYPSRSVPPSNLSAARQE